ncbi:MAG: trypsin-like peptidase domain-containing protein [Candidatus Dojkabacteria bacterium]
MEQEKNKLQKNLITVAVLTSFVFSSIFGIAGGVIGYNIANSRDELDRGIRSIISRDVEVINQESAIIDVAEQASKAVVSIVISRDVPIYEDQSFDSLEDFFNYRFRRRNQIGTEQKQVGSGTGFIVSADGLVITNRHVVEDEEASFTVIFNDGEKYPAEVIARDSLLDIAILQIDSSSETEFPFLELGSSDELKVGQTVIAIGNSLGQFSNTVSAGIISGLGRDIVAGSQSGGNTETLLDVIQTDASINFGNSGGPLLDLSGKVIGVNVAIAQNAENIGFSIPVNEVVKILERLERTGSLDRPLLGVRFTIITDDTKPALKEAGYEIDDKLDYGAIIRRGNNSTQVAVQPDSPAAKAGLVDGDIILEVDGERVDEENPLDRIIQNKFIGDKIELKVLRGSEEIYINVEL